MLVLKPAGPTLPAILPLASIASDGPQSLPTAVLTSATGDTCDTVRVLKNKSAQRRALAGWAFLPKPVEQKTQHVDRESPKDLLQFDPATASLERDMGEVAFHGRWLRMSCDYHHHRHPQPGKP